MPHYDPFIYKKLTRTSRSVREGVWILLILSILVIFLAIYVVEMSQRLDLVVSKLEQVSKDVQILRETASMVESISSQIIHWQPHYSRQVAASVSVHILRVAAKYGVDSSLVVAVGALESRWDLDARGGSGERGPLQVLPSTFKWLGGKNLRDWRETTEMGVKYLSMALKKAGGDTRLAVALYNCGINKAPGRAWKLASRHVQRFDRIMFRT